MLRRLIYILIVAIACVQMWSCNTSGCLENRSSIPLAGFYASSTGKAISIDSLQITGIGKDVPLYDGKTPISEAYLPMRSTEESTAWELTARISATIDETVYHFAISDTIRWEYTARPYFASEECGVVYYYNIKHMSYTKHLIDSVVITDSLITNLDVERIKIYYRTKSADE